MYKLNKIRKEYKNGSNSNIVVNDVTLTIGNTGFICMLGESGSGKTTLLNILALLDREYTGELLIYGKPLKKMSRRNIRRLRNSYIGYVFQSYNLIENVSVIENVILPMRVAGNATKARIDAANKLIKRVGLEGYETTNISKLSGGQKQRVAIARAISNEQRIIICDEPTGALDYDTGISIMELLKEMSKDKLVIMSTHNSEYANKYADTVLRITDGKTDRVGNRLDRDQTSSFESSRRNNFGSVIAQKLFIGNLLHKKDKPNTKKWASSYAISLTIALLIACIFNSSNLVIDKIFEFIALSDYASASNAKDVLSNFFTDHLNTLILFLMYSIIAINIASYYFTANSSKVQSQSEIGILFVMGSSRPSIILINVVKNIITTLKPTLKAVFWTLVVVLVLNGIFSVRSLISADYIGFGKNFIDVFANTIGNFVFQSGDVNSEIVFTWVMVLRLYIVVLLFIFIFVPLTILSVRDKNIVKVMSREL